MPRIVVLAGGIGGAKFLTGVRAAVADRGLEPAECITAVVNTADDLTLHGLRICPDLDSVMYTLGDGIDPERGWGRRDETFTVREELAAYEFEPTWFGLGDRDIATHLVRTQLLASGAPLSEVTEALCSRWRPGVRLLPMTDDRVETHVVVDHPEGGRRAIHFQEWWVRFGARLPAHSFVPIGADRARPAPGVLKAIGDAAAVIIAPSNPVVSIGTILSVPGVGDAVRSCPGMVVGLSPIVSARPVRGMADACLAAIGVPVSAAAVGCHYGARSSGGLLDSWLVDLADKETAVEGVEVRAVPLLMTELSATTAMAARALEAANV